jgi:hypothetical protein
MEPQGSAGYFQAFCGLFSGILQAHFLFIEIGKYIGDNFQLQVLFSLCSWKVHFDFTRVSQKSDLVGFHRYLEGCCARQQGVIVGKSTGFSLYDCIDTGWWARVTQSV